MGADFQTACFSGKTWERQTFFGDGFIISLGEFAGAASWRKRPFFSRRRGTFGLGTPNFSLARLLETPTFILAGFSQERKIHFIIPLEGANQL